METEKRMPPDLANISVRPILEGANVSVGSNGQLNIFGWQLSTDADVAHINDLIVAVCEYLLLEARRQKSAQPAGVMTVADWVGRNVKIVDGIEGTIGEVGTVLAVDDTPYRPSAWVRVHEDCDYPAYRSCELCWLEDVVSSDVGPVWGTGVPKASIAAGG